jgi:hypothetical protein
MIEVLKGAMEPMATDKQNKQGALIVALQDAVNSGSLSKDLLLELTEQFGLEAAQELVLPRIEALKASAKALKASAKALHRRVRKVLFSDEFAKETGNWPRPASYGG